MERREEQTDTTPEWTTDDPPDPFWEAPVPPPPAPVASGRGTRALTWFLAAMLGATAGSAATYGVVQGFGSGDRVEFNVTDPPVDEGEGVPENTPARVAQALLPSIVQIDVAGRFGGGGLGSGVILSEDGYIVTNHHVVADATDITVNLHTGESLPATVVGTAMPTTGQDIAVIKVAPSEPLPAATLGSSRDVRVGDLAVAIGSPFGLQATVTSGIISALHRSPDELGIIDAIQTDAAINPGNSGGALANARGEVIGINTAIVGNQTNAGVGFAIPIDVARKLAEQLIETGEAQLPFLGISGDDLVGGRGARVATVEPGTGAAEAGIQVGDVIVELDGEPVTSMTSLISLLLEKDVGEPVRVVVERDGERITLTATLGARGG